MRDWQVRLGSLFAVCLGILGLTGCSGNVSDKDIEYVEVGHVRALLADAQKKENAVLVIDPRTPSAYEQAHLPGAINLQSADLDNRFGKDPAIDRYNRIIVYGDQPNSAAAKALAKEMMRQKYKQVRVYNGGLAEWRDLGYPVAEPSE